MRIALALCTIALSCISVHAQQVKGITTDDQGNALAGSSITLKKIKDSSIAKLAISDNKGTYEFIHVPTGKYFISISHIGFLPAASGIFEVKDDLRTDVPSISLSKTPASLREAVVTAQKPVIEVKADKIVLNVEGSINAVGQDALELLRKSPGVMVDKDDNLSLSGKNGVQVFIDGRPTPLSGKDLSEYLKTIPSASIESIELITNPSAKYEAAGNAGIINIRLKKNKAFGTNGSAQAGYNISTYAKYNGGISLNYRDQGINIFGNYNYSSSINESFAVLSRTQLDTLFDNHSSVLSKTHAQNFKAGLDYTLNKSSSLGMIVSGTFSDNDLRTGSLTPIIYIPSGQLDRTLEANNRSSSQRDNTNVNLNYRFADTSRHELNADADYGHYRLRSDQLQPNYYFDPAGSLLYSNVYNMLSPSDIDIYSLKSDYEQNFAKGRLGLGFKSSYVKTGNDFEQFNVYDNGRKIKDTLHSNDFDYRENINAAYANYNRNGKGWVIQAGLRMENTNVKGISTGYRQSAGGYSPYDSGFNLHYVNFFPSGALTWNKNPAKQWTLNYSRRIDRPTYQDLNPFEFKLDEYTFVKGNTQLRPQYTNSIGLTFLYKYKLTTTLNYSHVKDVFTQIFDTTESSKAFIIKRNLATQDITSLNISYPFQRKWYSAFFNASTYYSLYKADFGAGRTVNLNVFAATVYAQQTAKFAKHWTAELSGFFNSPSIIQGTFKAKSVWTVDAGLSRTILKGSGTLKASVSDLFNSLHWSAVSNFTGQVTNIAGRFESRQLKLYFSYRFGRSQIKAARSHKLGSEEEQKRVGGAQGGGVSNN